VTGTIDDATATALGVYTPDPATATTQPAAEQATVADEQATVADEPATVADEPATVATEPATVADEPAAPLARETAQDPPTPVAANDAALGGEGDGGGPSRSVIVPLLAVGALALAVFLRRRQVVARRARARRRSSGARRPFTV